ncbi:docking protein 2 isoform X2 [Takifugu flavidus]|uniref:docking protein 2 isoform X2 n=1 Tax=Takifugu flavidus TaxID=433684 RepID=UPI002544D27C|nr:docking protein 2 isoform X2 [Takifugu flavidus]
MEEDIRKQGMLYLQQQRFGKRWKRVWCVLYRENSCSVSRLEFFVCKDGGSVEKNDRSLRKQLEHKKVIRLADCIRVSELELDGCPRDTGPFLIETTEKIYVFAVHRQQLDDWTHKLCEVAFPMNWTETSMKRSLQRGQQPDNEEGMEDNSLYSGREMVCEFRVCIRRTKASDRCRLKGDYLLRADVDALLLIDMAREAVLTWPYRYLRRFGRDKSSFSFEAGRRCDSGEGSFEFDTKQGNFLFKAVEAAINCQRTLPHQQVSRVSRGSQAGTEMHKDQNQNLNLLPPLPLPRSHVPQCPAAQTADGVYSMVTEPLNIPTMHHKDSSAPNQHQHRPLQCHLEPPTDKTLTSVKSLNLDVRSGPVPRKNQVKMISSCPLPQPSTDTGPGSGSGPQSRDQTYSQVQVSAAAEVGVRRECLIPPEPEYSLPFDTVTANVLKAGRTPGPTESVADPLYDSIDETLIRNIFLSDGGQSECRKVEHIYDEPEGCAAPTLQKNHASVYDDPEEMRGDAWRIMGTAADPKSQDPLFNPDGDYAVPKRLQRKLADIHSTTKEERVQEEPQHEQTADSQGSPYTNVMANVKCSSVSKTND